MQGPGERARVILSASFRSTLIFELQLGCARTGIVVNTANGICSSCGIGRCPDQMIECDLCHAFVCVVLKIVFSSSLVVILFFQGTSNPCNIDCNSVSLLRQSIVPGSRVRRFPKYTRNIFGVYLPPVGSAMGQGGRRISGFCSLALQAYKCATTRAVCQLCMPNLTCPATSCFDGEIFSSYF